MARANQTLGGLHSGAGLVWASNSLSRLGKLAPAQSSEIIDKNSKAPKHGFAYCMTASFIHHYQGFAPDFLLNGRQSAACLHP